MNNASQRRIQGVDEPLPEGETILWTGTPDARAVAWHVMHLRLWVGYMLALAVVVGVTAVSSLRMADVGRVMLFPLLLTTIVVAGIGYFARATARTSQYVVTTKRVVLRIGVAFPIAINIPLRLVDEADQRTFRDGTGEIRLTLSPDVKLAYIALWPHVECLRSLSHPQPKLRGLAVPASVGAALQAAMRGDGHAVAIGDLGPGRTTTERPAPRVTPTREAIAR